MQDHQKLNFPIEAGVISFKNLSSGFLKFAKKEKPGSRSKDNLITKDTIYNFQIELKKLIMEICNINFDFTEREV